MSSQLKYKTWRVLACPLKILWTPGTREETTALEIPIIKGVTETAKPEVMTEAVSDKIGYANRGFTGMLSDTAAQEEQKGGREGRKAMEAPAPKVSED